MSRSLVRHLLLVLAIALLLAGLALLLLSAPVMAPAGGFPDGPPGDAPVVIFPASGAYVVAEVAATDAERQRGLMGRSSLDDGAGMLFVFPETVTAPFWMKDTLIPLSIAFIDQQGVVVDIQDMQPRDETLHYPAAPYRYALEVPQGWFARAGVAVGHRAMLPPL